MKLKDTQIESLNLILRGEAERVSMERMRRLRDRGLIAYEGERTVLSQKGVFQLARHVDPTFVVSGRQRPRVRAL